MTAAQADYPVYEPDLFAPDALREPFGHYRAIRDLGPVVKLKHPDVYALGRFEDVREALRSPETLISGQGVMFNALFNVPVEPPLITQAGGDYHARLRGVIAPLLMPAALKAQREILKAMLSDHLAGLMARARNGEAVDAVADLAQYLPWHAVRELVGLPTEGRDRMLLWSNAGFNCMGPEPLADEDTALFMEARTWFRAVDPQDLAPGSWSAALFEAVAQGKLMEQEARSLLSGLVMPSLDTTILASANLLYHLARNPEQWAALKADPGLIPAAVLEGVRYSAVVRWFSRVAAEDYAKGEVTIPKGARVMIMYGAANRDDRHYPDPDAFDIRRNPKDQLGWGNGPHSCVGMHLAKVEMELLLEVMLEQVEGFEAGPATLGANRGLYGFEYVPLRMW